MTVKRYGPHHQPRTNKPPAKGQHPGVPPTKRTKS